MSFSKKTIKDVELAGKTVMVRTDYNVPLKDDGSIRDDYRIEQSLETLKFLIAKKAKIIIISHLGRPDGKTDNKLSLKPLAKILSGMLKRPVEFASDSIGADRQKKLTALAQSDVLLLENLRFHPEEEANDQVFAKKLAQGIDLFVQDGFGVVHRKHASTDAITRELPSVAGLLLEKEVTTINQTMKQPKRPLMAIVGGAKIGDKIDVLKKLISIADFIAIGGAMANVFLEVRGVEVGESLVDEKELDTAQEIMELAEAEAKKRAFVFYLPQDGVVATSLDKSAKTRIVDWDAHVVADIQNYPRQAPARASKVAKDEHILDIGPFSGAFIAGSMQFANTVIWNGLMGVTETPSNHGPVGPFAHGTELMLDSLMGHYGRKSYSLIGGGDTSAYIESRKLTKCFNHVSTGGGASLELMAGKKLHGIEALQNK